MPHLLTLPWEILDLIVHAVTVRDDWQQVRDRYMNRGSLFNLALTCKALSEMALLRLYRDPSAYGDLEGHGALQFLVHTLYQRPDRATLITELTMAYDRGVISTTSRNKTSDVPRWYISPDDAKLFNKGFAEFGIVAAVLTSYGSQRVVDDDASDGEDQQGRSTEWEPYQISAIKAPHDPKLTDARWCKQAFSALAALAILKSPNLEHLKLVGDGFIPSRTVMQPGSLAKLTKLSWNCRGFPYSTGVKVDGSLNWLTAAAPKLRMLTLQNTSRIHGDLTPCSVTKLMLQSACMDVDSFRHMCRAFPALQRLSLSVEANDCGREGWGAPATCEAVVECLVQTHSKTLRYLRFDWTGTEHQHWPGDWPDRRPSSVSLAGLRGLTALTELIVAAPQLHRLDRHKKEEEFWASLLAPNLEVLRVVKFGPCHWSEQSLQSAIDESCKNMRRVEVNSDCYPREGNPRDREQKKGYDFIYNAKRNPDDVFK